MTTTWNSGDKTSNVTLSGSDLIATLTSSSYGGVRATASASSGKYYFEIKIGAGLSTNVAVGWANATASLSTYIGQDLNSWSWFYYTAGTNIWINNGSIMTTVGASVGATIGIAFDIDNKNGWVRVGNGYWNGSPTADPASNTGGFSLSSLNAGPYFPVWNSNVNGAQITANFGASTWAAEPPSGFSSFDANALTHADASKELGYALLSSPDAASASKELGYALLGAPLAAISSKFVSYGVLSTPSNAVSASKVVGYALLRLNNRKRPTLYVT